MKRPKILLLVLLFLALHQAEGRTQIVFPSPTLMEAGSDSLFLGGSVSMYAADTTTFHLDFFRENILSGVKVKWSKKSRDKE